MVYLTPEVRYSLAHGSRRQLSRHNGESLTTFGSANVGLSLLQLIEQLRQC
jgi:hypothetical protein